MRAITTMSGGTRPHGGLQQRAPTAPSYKLYLSPRYAVRGNPGLMPAGRRAAM